MNMKLKSDLASWSKIPGVKLRVSMPHPLALLILQVPPLEESPLYCSKAEAGVMLLKEIRKELLYSPRAREVIQLGDIARPFASD